jgi:thiamine-phosphate pyrophosphorylase
VDLAVAVEADGVHLGQEDLPIEAVRRIIGEKMAIGLSTHSMAQAEKAVRDGADYIGVGPIFKTYTKKDVCDPVGFEYLDIVVQKIEIPFVAIGGVKEGNIRQVREHGASCIALVTEIVGADNIPETISRLRKEAGFING